jgi:UDP-N-acetylmuramyl tripeptide synthase
VAAMAEAAQAKVVFFGVSDELRTVFLTDDELHHGDAVTGSGEKALAELQAIRDDERIVIAMNGTPTVVKLAASSTFNAQNAAGVAALALAVGVPPGTIAQTLSDVPPAFGRGEQIDVGGRNVVLQLVKNPGGFRHALLSHQRRRYDQTVIAINDDFADGRDVSWLWDVDFGDAANCGRICTTGSRAHDMGLRLKYEGIPVDATEPSLEKALDQTLEQTPPRANVLIYSTYTAMLALRRLLSQRARIEKV